METLVLSSRTSTLWDYSPRTLARPMFFPLDGMTAYPILTTAILCSSSRQAQIAKTVSSTSINRALLRMEQQLLSIQPERHPVGSCSTTTPEQATLPASVLQVVP